jgi:hypothetical protein
MVAARGGDLASFDDVAAGMAGAAPEGRAFVHLLRAQTLLANPGRERAALDDLAAVRPLPRASPDRSPTSRPSPRWRGQPR